MTRRGLVVCWSAWLLNGCPADPAPGDDCVGEPDFFLTIESETGVLPRDLKLEVTYGGGTETYSAAPGAKPQVVFCTGSGGMPSGPSTPAEAGDTGFEGGRDSGGSAVGGNKPVGGHAGSAGVAQEALECQLWTEGPATIRVAGLGYESMERELKVDASVCTTAVEVELELKNPFE
jgi:hypothetical protein